jgi:hypothetical protein
MPMLGMRSLDLRVSYVGSVDSNHFTQGLSMSHSERKT